MVHTASSAAASTRSSKLNTSWRPFWVISVTPQSIAAARSSATRSSAVTGGDVRMAQYGLNRELAAVYARMARDKGYKGLFCVVSDPVDPLCRAALLESNRDENGILDGGGLFPHQVKGFGLGVMNARAAYYAKRDSRFAEFLTDGRSFGPHGEDLVIANSVSHYDDALSRELTDLAAHKNLRLGGLHLHCNSITRSPRVYGFMARKTVDICREFGLLPDYVDMGGGKGYYLQIRAIEKGTDNGDIPIGSF